MGVRILNEACRLFVRFRAFRLFTPSLTLSEILQPNLQATERSCCKFPECSGMRVSRMCGVRGRAEKVLGRGTCNGIGFCFRTVWHNALFGRWCWAATVCAGFVLCWCAGGVSAALWCCRVVMCGPSDRTVLIHMHGTESTMHLGTSLHPLGAVPMLCCFGEEAWRVPNQIENNTVVVTWGRGRFK